MRAATLPLPPPEVEGTRPLRAESVQLTAAGAQEGPLEEAPTAVMQRPDPKRAPWDTEAVLASREPASIQAPRRPSHVRISGAYHQLAPNYAVTEVHLPSAEHDSANGHEREQADELFRVAEVLLERGHAREAVFRAQRALKLCKPRPAQQALYAWLLYLRGDRSQPVSTSVWEHLNEALRADPQCQQALHYKSLLMRAP